MVDQLPRSGAWVGQFWNRPATEVRRDAARIEDAGYAMIWIAEPIGREVFSLASLVLTSTSRLVVATGIANVWARDSVAMRNGARTLAEAYPGRFLLGVGIGTAPSMARRGHHYSAPIETMRAYLQAMAKAPYTGPAPGFEHASVIGALGDRMLSLAAEFGFGAHPYLVTAEHTARARSVLGADAWLAPEQAVLLCTESDQARAAARAHLQPHLALDTYVRSFRRQGFTDADIAGGGSNRLVDSLVAWGDVDRIEQRVREHFDAGAQHVALQPLVASADSDPVDTLAELAGVVTTRAQQR